MDVLPLFVHKQQDEGQREQSQDAGCDGQSHWYGAWRIAREKVRVAFTGQTDLLAVFGYEREKKGTLPATGTVLENVQL